MNRKSYRKNGTNPARLPVLPRALRGVTVNAMKTAVILMGLLLTVPACNKTPDDPGRYRKPEVPRSTWSGPLLQSLPHEQADEAPRSVPSAPRREPVTRWM
jgi:hypothetical protein